MPLTVQQFCKRLYAALNKESWGCIEPDVFHNIGENISDPDNMWFDKMSQDEMVDAVESMKAILETILKEA